MKLIDFIGSVGIIATSRVYRQAPEGSTAYRPEDKTYYKVDGLQTYYNDGAWVELNEALPDDAIQLSHIFRVVQASDIANSSHSQESIDALEKMKLKELEVVEYIEYLQNAVKNTL